MLINNVFKYLKAQALHCSKVSYIIMRNGVRVSRLQLNVDSDGADHEHGSKPFETSQQCKLMKKIA